jgi:hypothetical protein
VPKVAMSGCTPIILFKVELNINIVDDTESMVTLPNISYANRKPNNFPVATVKLGSFYDFSQIKKKEKKQENCADVCKSALFKVP